MDPLMTYLGALRALHTGLGAVHDASVVITIPWGFLKRRFCQSSEEAGSLNVAMETAGNISACVLTGTPKSP